MEKTCKKIMIVDDNAVIALSEKLVIESFGYEVVTAYSGPMALDLIAEDSDIALVLMEAELGGSLAGTEAAQRILERKRLPVVFLVDLIEDETVTMIRETFGCDCVLKSSGDFVLLQSIERALRRESSSPPPPGPLP